MDSIDLSGIKARLGSLSPTALWRCGGAAERLLTRDMPFLLEMVDHYQGMGIDAMMDVASSAINLVQKISSGDIESINSAVGDLYVAINKMAELQAKRKVPNGNHSVL